VVQLSDLHFNPYQTREHLARIVSLANAEHPDLVRRRCAGWTRGWVHSPCWATTTATPMPKW
jgi:predicted MPP superfamily phosphohydrolase